VRHIPKTFRGRDKISSLLFILNAQEVGVFNTDIILFDPEKSLLMGMILPELIPLSPFRDISPLGPTLLQTLLKNLGREERKEY